MVMGFITSYSEQRAWQLDIDGHTGHTCLIYMVYLGRHGVLQPTGWSPYENHGVTAGG